MAEEQKQKNDTVIASGDEYVRQLEYRLTRLERDVSQHRAEIQTLQKSLNPFKQFLLRWHDKFSPRLFTFHQYQPRPLTVPQHYVDQRLLMKPHRIAIVTPSYNQGAFIEATINSVIGQNYPNLEYHVQDGGSTDATVEILRRYSERISISSRADEGQSDAINLGFQQVDGEIMGYLNSDDCLMPGSLTYVSNFFHNNPSIDVIYSHRILIDQAGLEIGRNILPAHDNETLKWFDPIPQETMFWRRHVWTTIGGIDRNFDYAMDWDFILRAQKAGFHFVRVPRFLGMFRVHEHQKTSRALSKGLIEMQKLRQIHLKKDPSAKEFNRAIASYVRRHVLAHRLYKLRLLKT